MENNFAPSSIATCNGSVLRNNVMMEGLFQDLPKFEPPIQGLVSAVNVALHCTVIRQVDSSARALYLPRSFANVPVNDSFKGVEVCRIIAMSVNLPTGKVPSSHTTFQ